MQGKQILWILCAAAILSCAPIQGLVSGGGSERQSESPTNGTVTIRQHSDVTRTTSDGEEQTSIEHLVTIGLVDGRATASISYDEKRHASSHMDNGIIIIDDSVDETTRAEGKSLPATIQVIPSDNGTYTISFDVKGIKGTWTRDSQISGRCVITSRACGAPQDGSDHRSTEVDDVGGVDGDITGKADARQPRSFSGSTTEIIDETIGLERTITWDLRGR